MYSQPSVIFQEIMGGWLEWISGIVPERISILSQGRQCQKVKEMNKFSPTSPLDVHLSGRYNCIINKIKLLGSPDGI